MSKSSLARIFGVVMIVLIVVGSVAYSYWFFTAPCSELEHFVPVASAPLRCLE